MSYHTERYLCLFREIGNDFFVTDCSMPTEEQAIGYVKKIVTQNIRIAEGVVKKNGKELFTYSAPHL